MGMSRRRSAWWTAVARVGRRAHGLAGGRAGSAGRLLRLMTAAVRLSEDGPVFTRYSADLLTRCKAPRASGRISQSSCAVLTTADPCHARCGAKRACCSVRRGYLRGDSPQGT
jgi:hypothetical protein